MTARVLVVDDVELNVKLLEAKLTSEYFEVLTANNGATALEIADAKDVTIEFHSFSKTFSMAGLRIGFAVGNPRRDRALTGLSPETALAADHPRPGMPPPAQPLTANRALQPPG